MDDLSMSLNNVNIKVHINNAKCNHANYADDLCLISISFTGRQTLLNICEEYGSERDVIYNNKNQCLCALKWKIHYILVHLLAMTAIVVMKKRQIRKLFADITYFLDHSIIDSMMLNTTFKKHSVRICIVYWDIDRQTQGLLQILAWEGY